LALVTRTTKLHNGSRRTPAATVSASPPIGAHEINRLKRPHLWYHPVVRSSDFWLTGNHVRSRKRSTPRPSEEVVPASEYRILQNHIRELHRLLGKKTIDAEIIKGALDATASLKNVWLAPLQAIFRRLFSLRHEGS